MPVIRIDYDNDIVKSEDVTALSEATRKIVIEVTGIEDVVVYTNSWQIKVGIHPIEVFVQISGSKVPGLDKLFEDIKSKLIGWKKENSFSLPVSLTLIPMDWKFEVRI